MVGNSNYNPVHGNRHKSYFAALGVKILQVLEKLEETKSPPGIHLISALLPYAGKYREERNLQRPTPKDSIFYPGSNNVLYQLNPHEQIRAEWHRKNIISGVGFRYKILQR